MIFVEAKALRERLAACASCEHKKVTIAGVICGKCGCVIKLKAALQAQQCPLGKWLKE